MDLGGPCNALFTLTAKTGLSGPMNGPRSAVT